jgi:PAS domain S-box-containing protein
MPPAPLPPNEEARLSALRSYHALETASEEAFDNIAALAAKLTGCPTALVTLVDEHRQLFKGRVGLGVSETPRDRAFCAHAILEPDRPLVVADATRDDRFKDNALVTGDLGLRFYAGVPLVNPDGHSLGTLCVIDYRPRALDPGTLDILTSLAKTAMSALELHKATVTIQRAAKDTAERFAQVIAALPVAVIICTEDGTLRLVNGAAERLFGYGPGALLGRTVDVLVPEGSRSGHAALRAGFLRQASTRAMGAGRELYCLRRDGSAFAVEIGLTTTTIGDERLVLAGIADVTARHEAEQAKELHRQELERSNRELESFAYAASHDLKAPLRAITNLADWIAEDMTNGSASDAAENLALLQGRASRMAMLLDGMLDYAKAGHAVSTVEDVDTMELMRAVEAMVAPAPGFVIACEGALPVIRTSRTPLQVVLTNLVGNAIKHHDRSEGRVVVSAVSGAGVTTFRVADDGPGIPAGFHERIFAIFQTLASRDDVESSGIGLAIVKRRVTAFGGRIWVESAPPARGTTFVFTWKESAP